MDPIIRVVVVDDSAFVRKVVREILSRSPFVEVVGMARDGEEALALVEQLKPDVVTCDLLMPRLGGVEFVRQQMSRKAVPILILSSSPRDGEQVMEALQLGAIDFVRKPTALAHEELWTIREQLTEKVKAAARAPLRPSRALSAPIKPSVRAAPVKLKSDIVVLGISTGGPQALRYLLPQLPADFPVPIAIVLHMPVGYTAMYAAKLNELCALTVREAHEGAVLEPGTAILARAGRHLVLDRTAAGMVQARLTSEPLDKPHRPSVDVLFRSAADIYRSRVLAVVMTGMGDDGKEGAAWVKAHGGVVLTETEESCVIYGMPRSIVESGLSDAAFPLDTMAEAITKLL